MKTLTIDVPDSLLAAAGSESDARRLMVKGAIAELVKLGRLTPDEATNLLDESDAGWMQLADTGGAFDFWHDPDEEVYSEQSGEAI